MTEVYDLSATNIDLFRRRVAQFFGITVRELFNGKHTARLRAVRDAAMWVLRNRYRLSLGRSAAVAGRNTADTAINSCRRVEERRASDPVYAEQLDELVRRLTAEIPPPPT